VAFRISLNRWQGEQRLQLDVKALRPHYDRITLCRGTNHYIATRSGEGLTLSNDQGRTIAAQVPDEEPLNSEDPLAHNDQVRHLLEEASLALGLRP
jgi:single-stranded-DNA-specific exonuclease